MGISYIYIDLTTSEKEVPKWKAKTRCVYTRRARYVTSTLTYARIKCFNSVKLYIYKKKQQQKKQYYIGAASGETRLFAYAKTKTQISFAVTAKLIGAFVFATRIVQSLYFLNPKFQVSSHFLWLYSPVCVGPGRKPRRPVFSQRGSYYIDCWI